MSVDDAGAAKAVKPKKNNGNRANPARLRRLLPREQTGKLFFRLKSGLITSVIAAVMPPGSTQVLPPGFNHVPSRGYVATNRSFLTAVSKNIQRDPSHIGKCCVKRFMRHRPARGMVHEPVALVYQKTNADRRSSS
jgi:hypothetical protein